MTAATAESKEFLRGATEFLKEAVRVVPPDEASGSGGGTGSGVQGVMWDGMDVWTIPMTVGAGSETPKEGTRSEGKVGGSKARKSGEVKAIATRKEAILRTLRTNPDILKVDPRAEPRTKALFEEWEKKDVEGLEGGVSGEAWIEKIQKELEVDMDALTTTRDILSTLFYRYYYSSRAVLSILMPSFSVRRRSSPDREGVLDAVFLPQTPD